MLSLITLMVLCDAAGHMRAQTCSRCWRVRPRASSWTSLRRSTATSGAGGRRHTGHSVNQDSARFRQGIMHGCTRAAMEALHHGVAHACHLQHVAKPFHLKAFSRASCCVVRRPWNPDLDLDLCTCRAMQVGRRGRGAHRRQRPPRAPAAQQRPLGE